MQKAYKVALIGYLFVLVISALAPIVLNNEQLQSAVLFPMFLILVYITKMKWEEVGLNFGSLKDYVWAILYPLGICLPIILIALVTGNIGGINYSEEMTGKIAYLFFMTLILAFTTEEGFFRGWLFGVLERDQINPKLILILTAIAFALWHFPLFFIDPGFVWTMLPLYLIGGIVGGLIFGLLRYISGSIIVSSFSHALWNTIVYILFGFGSSIGVLNIKMTGFYHPESGLLGLIFGIIFMVILWFWTSKKIGFNSTK